MAEERSSAELTAEAHASRPPADADAYRPGAGRATMLPLAAERAERPRLAIVDVSIGTEMLHYDANVYTWLVRSKRGKGGEEATVRKAAELTERIQKGELTFNDVVEQLQQEAKQGLVKLTDALGAAPKPTGVEKAVAPISTDAEPARLAAEQSVVAESKPPKPAISQDLPASVSESLHLPKVKVKFVGPFGTVNTRYHNAEITGDFLVLVFEKRCEIVDMYEPPELTTAIKVQVEKDSFYVKSLGLNLDLATRGLYLVVLAVLPADDPEAQLAEAEAEGAFDEERGLINQMG